MCDVCRVAHVRLETGKHEMNNRTELQNQPVKAEQKQRCSVFQLQQMQPSYDQASSNRGSGIASLSGYLTQGEYHKRQHRRRRGPNKKTSSASGTTNQLFAEDPWNAICVLGLRVYARAEKAAEVRVVRDEDD